MPAFTISRTPAYPKPYLAVDLANDPTIHRAIRSSPDHNAEPPPDSNIQPIVHLAAESEREGVSLNNWINTKLASTVKVRS